MNEATEKHHAHELIERLPDSQIAVAIRFLELLQSAAWSSQLAFSLRKIPEPRRSLDSVKA